MNPYKILGIDQSISLDDLKTAYRLKAKETHPDANPNDPKAKEKFQEVQAAYEMLAKVLSMKQVEQRPQDIYVDTRDYIIVEYTFRGSFNTSSTSW